MVPKLADDFEVFDKSISSDPCGRLRHRRMVDVVLIFAFARRPEASPSADLTETVRSSVFPRDQAAADVAG